jgi:5-hydroxyisourate hydrolase-like protein (transthyretin family)
MERKFARRHVMAMGLALSLGALSVLSLLAGLGGLRQPGALAAHETLPAADSTHALAATGGITGLVLAENSGAPLAGVVVKIYDGVSFALLYTTTTDADGHYSATVTSPYSQARLFFDGSAVAYATGEWYDDKAFFSQADRVYLQEGAVVTDVNVSLAERGIMSGTITLEGGAPAIDVCVTLLEVNEGCDAHTDALGQFIIAGLSGTYRLRFSGGAFPGIRSEYYRDKYSPDEADEVTVTARATAAFTAEVTSRNVITGLVTDEISGIPIGNARIVLYDKADTVVRDLTLPCFSCAPGEYRFYVLNPGDYRLEFRNLPYHATEFYSNQQTLADATVVSITATQVITGINAALITGLTGTLAVTLTQDNYQPLSSTHAAYVELYDPSSGEGLATIGSINGDGSTVTYTFVVSGGDYLVYLGANYPLLGEWYDDQPVSSTAAIVSITPGVTTTISANLAVTTAPGCITGTATSGGLPLQGALVRIYRIGDDKQVRARDVWTDANGAYDPICVQPGDYQVTFSYYPSATTWYSNTLTRAAADTVAITSDVTLTNVNGVLGDLGGCVSGQVVNLDNQAVVTASIQIRDVGGNLPFWRGLYGTALADQGNADVDSGFVACGLASGTYIVQCPHVGSSAPITVSASQVTSGVICRPYAIYLPVVMRDSG